MRFLLILYLSLDLQGLPDLAPLDVTLLAEDTLQPAGVVLSVLEGVVVVQGLSHAVALAEGCVHFGFVH
jgi:hypothetical protein